MILNQKIKSVEEHLSDVDYDFSKYIPSSEAINFINFIKLVGGDNPESHNSPVVHYKLLDKMLSPCRRLAILCHRGFAKSTVCEYLFFYIAVFVRLNGLGKVGYALFIADTAENGGKNLRKNMEFRYLNSAFLQKYLPGAKFTDAFIEFTNVDGEQFAIRIAGAQQSIRGTRYLNQRPKLAIMDDLLSDIDAKSPTCVGNVDNTIQKGVAKALDPNENKILYVGTVFNANDPLYKVISSGFWDTAVFPICEKFPCTEEEFKGSWEDRFSYKVVKEMYDEAVAMGRPSDFFGEMMNQVISDEEKLIVEANILWYDHNLVMRNRGNFNFYITTDFATAGTSTGDFSVISVWALNSAGFWYYVDGVCAKQQMDKNIEDLFRFVQYYRPLSVGVEISGQQGGFVTWLKTEMIKRNIFFNFAGKNKAGLRPIGDKLARFKLVVPLFSMHRVYLPEQKKDTPALLEALNELRLATFGGLKAKHDDFLDTVSTLIDLDAIPPLENDVNLVESADGIWEEAPDTEYQSSLASYVV